MVRLVQTEWSYETTKQELCDQESHIIKILDWELLSVTPLFFLERYVRLFGIQ